MSLELYADYETCAVLPAIMVHGDGHCACCGARQFVIEICWLFWGVALGFEIPQ